MNEVFSALGEAPADPAFKNLACLPVFFSLGGKRVVLSGDTDAVRWKAELCCATGAKVEVFGERPCEGLCRLAANNANVSLRLRPIAAADFAGAALAITGAEDALEIARLQTAARAAGVPLNVIDAPNASDFQFGAIVNRSPLVIGISTGGAAPKLAQALRGWIEALLPEAIQPWARAAKVWREKLASSLVPKPARRGFWEFFGSRALTASSPPDDGELNALLAEASAEAPAKGCVALVGAGPGDPELLTLKALRALQSAEVVLYDDLVSPEIVAMARREAEKICVGKRGYRPSCRQDHIIEKLVALALSGKRVVRLKGGDPMVFGRANEEIGALRAAGIPVEVIPGVTAALGAAASLQVSLTERDKARRLQFVTAHAHGGRPEDVDWRALCDERASTAIYMGAKMLSPLSEFLVANGLDPKTPAILVEWATCRNERRISGTIADLPGRAARLEPSGPCIILLGAVFANAMSLPRIDESLGTRLGDAPERAALP